MKTADLLLDCLYAQGVRMIYGVPGEENADVMISLLNHKIQFITCTHEQTASFMANMHGYFTGIPGVCLATLGPGATNLMTGVAQATLDNIPLVALIGQCSSTRLHKISHQNVNAIDMFRPITKWVTTVTSPVVLPEVIAKAFKVAISGLPGAVVVEIPEDIAELQAEGSPLPKAEANISEASSTTQIDAALNLLQKAKKPLVLIGNSAVRTESDKPLRTFLEKTKLYAAYTFMGKGAISNLYERSLHCVGLGIKDLAIEAFEASDLVICVGYNMVEWAPERWNVGVKKDIIHIDTDAAEVDALYQPNVEMVGFIPSIMQQLSDAVKSVHVKKDAYFEAIQKKVQTDIRGFADDARFPMTPKRILRDIRDTLRDEDILISDVGAHKMWVARQYGARQSKTCFISNGFCAMGGSMPGAMEAKRLYPKKNVLALCGDGGFMMSVQALFTGVAYHIPFVVVVWDDHEYGLIRWKQEMHFHKHSHTHLPHHDLAGLARSIGCHSYHITKVEEFKVVLQEALMHEDAPTVIVVPVDYSENMKLFYHLKEVSTE